MTGRTCKGCGADFSVPYPSFKRKYCSPECLREHGRKAPRPTRSDAGTRKTEWTAKPCPCGRVFEGTPSDMRKRKYCSIACLNKYAPHGRHAQPDKKTITADGYVWIYLRPEQRPGGWSGHRYPEHRWVMMQTLGRELLPGENVHHVNGNRADNRPENLELWVTTQPKGQRPSDLVEWARTIIDRYGELV